MLHHLIVWKKEITFAVDGGDSLLRYFSQQTKIQMTPIINTKFPEFKLNAYQQGQFRTVSNEDIKGKWALFFFYPGDFTFVCPTELYDLSEHYQELLQLDVEVYACSCDSHFVHKAWVDASPAVKGVQYPMLADPAGRLAEALGILIEEDQQAYRGTFLVNPEGIIKMVEINDNSVGRDVSATIRKIIALQYVAEHGGEVCPANWRRGEKTLTPGIDLVGKI